MRTDHIKITEVDIKDLNPNEYNPRKHTEKQEKDLLKSIEKYGFIDPIVVNSHGNRKNIVIGGAFRLQVAKKLKYKTVPVVYIDIESIDKEKELNLRLNKNTGEWDINILKDFDIELLLDVGFDNEDLSEIWDSILEVENDFFKTTKELEKIKKPQSKIGDVYLLGKHKLMCGDSTDKETLGILMGKKKTSMIYCDPPYNIGLDYSKGIGGRKNYGGEFNSDSKTQNDYKSFIVETLKNVLNHAHENTHIFYWCDENYIGLFQEIYRENKIENKRVCLWIKNNQNVTPQIAFNKVYEPCVYGIIGKPYINKDLKNLHEVLNKEVATGNRCLDDIADLFNIWLEKRKDTSTYEHPTEKPATLHQKALKRCSKPGDIIVDLFGGSGSTLIACEQLNRICYTIEKDPIFCDLIIRRYEEYTGNKAVKL